MGLGYHQKPLESNTTHSPALPVILELPSVACFIVNGTSNEAPSRQAASGNTIGAYGRCVYHVILTITMHMVDVDELIL